MVLPWLSRDTLLVSKPQYHGVFPNICKLFINVAITGADLFAHLGKILFPS